jgi:ABC-type phosphate transport system substrate-binding protein
MTLVVAAVVVVVVAAVVVAAVVVAAAAEKPTNVSSKTSFRLRGSTTVSASPLPLPI